MFECLFVYACNLERDYFDTFLQFLYRILRPTSIIENPTSHCPVSLYINYTIFHFFLFDQFQYYNIKLLYHVTNFLSI